MSFWKDNRTHPALTIDSMRDVVYIFVNGKLAGSLSLSLSLSLNCSRKFLLMKGKGIAYCSISAIGKQNPPGPLPLVGKSNLNPFQDIFGVPMAISSC